MEVLCTMNEVSIASLRPGTVLTVPSTRFPLVQHWGVVGYGRDSKGYPRVWHSQKSDTLRCTDFEFFSAGQQCNIERVLERQQAGRAIMRLRNLCPPDIGGVRTSSHSFPPEILQSDS